LVKNQNEWSNFTYSDPSAIDCITFLELTSSIFKNKDFKMIIC
jgi:hypothetical protein